MFGYLSEYALPIFTNACAPVSVSTARIAIFISPTSSFSQSFSVRLRHKRIVNIIKPEQGRHISEIGYPQPVQAIGGKDPLSKTICNHSTSPFLEQKHNLLLYGPSGLEKAHIAHAIDHDTETVQRIDTPLR